MAEEVADLALVEGMLQTRATTVILDLVLEEIRPEQPILEEVVALALVIRIIQTREIPITLEVVDLALVEEIRPIQTILVIRDLVLEEILLVQQTQGEVVDLALVEEIRPIQTIPVVLDSVLEGIQIPVTLTILAVLDSVSAVIKTLAILAILVVLDSVSAVIQTREILVVLDLVLEEINLVRQTQEELEVLALAAIRIPAPLVTVPFLLETNRVQRAQALHLAQVLEHQLEQGQAAERLSEADGIIVPGGFGSRGTKGMMMAAEYAREQKVPYLGICMGMQIAVIEFARNVLGLSEADSSEFSPETKDPVIDLMPDQDEKGKKGGTMRLGAYPCCLREGSRLSGIYGEAQPVVYERHRHRYEFNNAYREIFEENGMTICGQSPDGRLAEAVELSEHFFYTGVQYHPEFKSRPQRPHPLFAAFIGAALQREQETEG